ncbi:AAA family ATPase [Novosphingobium album (ex Hu et al. 2023)]|uniref:AAA family ATPase n=1 Tax=Novosphingobium album (ex Hu et al. 2023) TaxID=2930093 RepID=A0ABT0B6G1_9SPHN|nr:bifunctional aminoglycoside phosphotransferase/ATP-binding protein [Novosphingobium album (ex Hu et al. 2023)]MCJ2180626.1 AAA family ATPase [Novosphingobium album (ex Hu et al. 2023)]
MRACDDQSGTIDLLSRPETYGLSGPVERIDTHAAMVFLAGCRAFKLKRAVRYPYLDFSTVDRRKAVCDAELALNRRTAPDLYLAVQPVGRQPDGRLTLGEGVPVDWVVVMRRFAPECLLDAMAGQGPLEPGLIRDLADGIAAFHDTADIVQGPGADRVRAVIDGNRASMAALPEDLLPAAMCDQLHRRSLAVLETLAPLLDKRGQSGHVRHCHGDLHLANICLWQGQSTLFDCLEFDPELATTDVLYDLAFLVMDMWQRGLHAGASLLFNRYCDMRAESDGLAAMPLFLSMRAAVRAHVNASAAARQSGDRQRAEKANAARGYLEAALAFLDRKPPRLIAVGGLSGTGKSTLAGHLAPLCGAAPGARWLRSDVLRKRLAGLPPEQTLPPEAYARERSAEVYRTLTEVARRTLASGMDVIVDAVFADPAERDAAADVAAQCGVAFTGLWLEAPASAMRERVGARRGDASDANAAVVDRQLGYDLGGLGAWRRIDAGGSPDTVLRAALEQLHDSGS